MARARALAALAVALLAAACGGGDRARTPTATPTEQAQRQCFGAAARASAGCAEEPLSVVPALSARTRDRGAPCRRTPPMGLVAPCAFGVPAAQAGRSFALIGDSHAGQLRSAFAIVAREQGWRGYAITRNSCAYAEFSRPLPEPHFSRCAEWKRQLPEWLARHPEVSTVFVVGLTRDAGVGPAGAADPFAAKVAGYKAVWERLPASVAHIVVVRDTPEMQQDTLACIGAALERSRPPGPACATRRAVALPPDPAVAAAQQLGPPRVQTIDLTRLMCDDRSCFPVVGGVLAYMDVTHLTPTFATTLGPFLLTEVRRLAASWE